MIAHGQSVGVDHREGKTGALQKRAKLTHIDKGRNTRRQAAFDSLSAWAKASRSSLKLSPPISAANSKPSGLSARRIWISVPGRSLTNCSASAETTRSSEASAKGRASSSAAMRGNTCRAARVRVVATIDATLPFADSARRTASFGVPRSMTRSKRRSTAPSRSASRRQHGRGERSRPRAHAPAFGARAADGDRKCRARHVHPRITRLMRSCSIRACSGELKTVLARLAPALRNGLRALWHRALDVVLPPLCPSCREPLGDGVGLCAACWSKLSLHRAALLRAAWHSRSPTIPAPGSFDGGDRRSAGL